MLLDTLVTGSIAPRLRRPIFQPQLFAALCNFEVFSAFDQLQKWPRYFPTQLEQGPEQKVGRSQCESENALRPQVKLCSSQFSRLSCTKRWASATSAKQLDKKE